MFEDITYTPKGIQLLARTLPLYFFKENFASFKKGSENYWVLVVPANEGIDLVFFFDHEYPKVRMLPIGRVEMFYGPHSRSIYKNVDAYLYEIGILALGVDETKFSSQGSIYSQHNLLKNPEKINDVGREAYRDIVLASGNEGEGYYHCYGAIQPICSPFCH